MLGQRYKRAFLSDGSRAVLMGLSQRIMREKKPPHPHRRCVSCTTCAAQFASILLSESQITRIKGLHGCPPQPSRRCVPRTTYTLRPTCQPNPLSLPSAPLSLFLSRLPSSVSPSLPSRFSSPVSRLPSPRLSPLAFPLPAPVSRLPSPVSRLPFSRLSPLIRLSLFLFRPCGLRLCLLCALPFALLSPFIRL